MLDNLRNQVPGEVFSYSMLMWHLRKFSKPRDKVTRLLRNGEIIRIKKGLYVFGEKYRRSLLCHEVLANLIYGPSYVSLQWALSFHGLIPERVFEATSITLGRAKLFQTPLGRFSYCALQRPLYPIGVQLQNFGPHGNALIASAEKAIVDTAWRQPGLRSVKDIELYLFEDLRLDDSEVENLNPTRLREIARTFSSPKVDKLIKVLGG